MLALALSRASYVRVTTYVTLSPSQSWYLYLLRCFHTVDKKLKNTPHDYVCNIARKALLSILFSRCPRQTRIMRISPITREVSFHTISKRYARGTSPDSFYAVTHKTGFEPAFRLVIRGNSTSKPFLQAIKRVHTDVSSCNLTSSPTRAATRCNFVDGSAYSA